MRETEGFKTGWYRQSSTTLLTNEPRQCKLARAKPSSQRVQRNTLMANAESVVSVNFQPGMCVSPRGGSQTPLLLIDCSLIHSSVELPPPPCNSGARYNPFTTALPYVGTVHSNYKQFVPKTGLGSFSTSKTIPCLFEVFRPPQNVCVFLKRLTLFSQLQFSNSKSNTVFYPRHMDALRKEFKESERSLPR